MSPSFSAVLLDCDGVLQRPSNDWQAELAALVAPADDETTAKFFAEISAAEAPTMNGSSPFAPRLQEVLDRWRVGVPAEQVLRVWQHLSVDPGMLDVVRQLRADGLVCALATNQHAERGAYMRAALGYEELFDPCFISCEMGVAKPDPAYFRLAVERLGLEPGEVFFTDDVVANVAGAREAGLVAEHFSKDGGRPELERVLALHGLVEPLAA